MLRHLVALGVEHQSRRDNVLEGYTVENHRCNGVQGEEPSACLVHTFVDEVGRECLVVVYQLTVLERIVNLGVGH